jgi:hypothetical protein
MMVGGTPPIKVKAKTEVHKRVERITAIRFNEILLFKYQFY